MGYNYSTFINALAKQNILINRKMLSEMAINNPTEFETLVKQVMSK
jgi:large subunit ribosomal protein L20